MQVQVELVAPDYGMVAVSSSSMEGGPGVGVRLVGVCTVEEEEPHHHQVVVQHGLGGGQGGAVAGWAGAMGELCQRAQQIEMDFKSSFSKGKKNSS